MPVKHTKKKKSGAKKIPVAAERAQLSARWVEIASHARKADWGLTDMPTLAAHVGMEWFYTRGNEPVSDFLAHDGDGLFALHGFGCGKIRRLCEIMELALERPAFESPIDCGKDPQKAIPPSVDPLETLDLWKVPAAFPTRLVALPVRMTNYCDEHKLKTLAQLLKQWDKLGFNGFIAQKNLGRLSVTSLASFIHSLQAADRETAQKFLPLHPSGKGLSLGNALHLAAAKLNPAERVLLERRLVEGMTLEESAEERGLTRERVRQMEKVYLDRLREWFDYFGEARTTILDDWGAERDWFGPLRKTAAGTDEDFLKASVEALFRDSPQAIARARNEGAKRDRAYEDLTRNPKLWFGGIPLSGFLETHVPPENRQAFCARVATTPALRIDFLDGKVHPARTSLRRTVVSLLALFGEPIPLTSLAHLLVATGYHPTVTTEKLLRRRREWESGYLFPKNMILWNE